MRLTTNVLLWRERIPAIKLVRVDQATDFIQKKNEGGSGLWWGQEVVNTLLDLEEEMGLWKKNSISGGWAIIKNLEINETQLLFIPRLTLSTNTGSTWCEFFHMERTSAEKMCEMYHVRITFRWMRGADGGCRLARDSSSLWFSTLVLLRHKQSVFVDCLKASKRLLALRQTQRKSAISTRFISAKEMLAEISPLLNWEFSWSRRSQPHLQIRILFLAKPSMLCQNTTLSFLNL